MARDFKRGQRLSADDLNAVVDQIADMLRAGPGLTVNRHGNLITITLQQRPILRRGDGPTTFVALTDTPGSIARGRIYQGNSAGTALVALAPGTAAKVLTVNSGGTDVGYDWPKYAPAAS